MKSSPRISLGITTIIAAAGFCSQVAAADSEDFSAMTDLETLSFERDGSREPGFSLSVNTDYGRGNYGGSQTSETLHLPLIGKYATGLWTFKLAVPYIRITDDASATTASRTEAGLGDIVTSAAYTVYKGKGAAPLHIDLAVKVKFGTASPGKDLGTGKNDYAFQAAIEKTVGKFTTSGLAGYRVNGSPAGTPLANVFYGSLSGSYRLSPKTSASLILDQRQRASVDGALHRKLTALLSHAMSKNWKVQTYVVKGLANGSADWGGGATVTHAFK